MPKTILGKWSVWLIVLFVIFLSIFYVLVGNGQKGGDTFFSNLWLATPVFIAGLSAITAFITGLLAVIKNQERSFLVYIATILGFLVLLFIFGEFAFPH